MGHSWGTKFVKYLLVGFNFLFLLSGIILIIIGASVKTVYRNYDTFLDDKYFSLPNLLIAIGCLTFFISFFGCYGAIKESWVLLYGFIGLLILIFIMEFSGGIAGYVLRDRTSDYLTGKLHEDLNKYGNKNATLIQKSWDVMQEQFKCCGVNGPVDWHETFNNSSLPLSCCSTPYGAIGSKDCIYRDASPTPAALQAEQPPAVEPETGTNATNKNNTSEVKTTVVVTEATVATEDTPKGNETSSTTAPTTAAPPVIIVHGVPYAEGCVEGFGKFIQSHAVTLGGVGFSIAVIQLLGILFACHLARQIKYGYYST